MIREQCVLVPMRDGVRAACEIWRPDGDGPFPGLVFRTPYGRGNDLSGYVEHGFACLIADGRGTGASEGTYDYYNLDAGRFDGYDLIEWLADQEWCNGRIAAVGGSALGIYAIAAAAENPPHLECLLLNVVPSDFYQHQWYPGGVRRQESRHGWCLGNVNRIGPGAVWDEEMAADTIQRPYKAALLAKRYHEYPDNPLDWSKPYFNHTERDDLWKDIDLTPKVAAITHPILFSGVHFDHFGKGTIAAHAAHQGPKHLSMQSGPISETGGWDYPWDETVAWLKYYLQDVGECPAGGEQWFITGAEKRIRLEAGRATNNKRVPLDQIITLKHDPLNPSLSALSSNPLAFDAYCEQEQVTCIDIDASAFPDAACIIGHPILHFTAQCAHPDAQLLARFCVVTAAGTTRMLNIGARRIYLSDDFSTVLPLLPDGQSSSLEFWTIAHQLQPGEKIRLALSISDSPCWDHPDDAMELTLSAMQLECELLDPTLL